jgi:hypothetical protein
MIHKQGCPTQGEHSDAAKRIVDWYSLHRIADPIGNLGRWFGCALADGSSDGVLYDTRQACIIHQKHNESYYGYIQIIPTTMTLCDAELWLSGNRKMYDAGIRLHDRDHRAGGLEVISRATFEDQIRQMTWLNRR